jgi:F420-dependent oxidoreductase-like protein
MQLRIFIEPQLGASYTEQLRIAQATEELGFDGFFRSEHYMPFEEQRLPGPTDSWVTLGAIARETSRIRLGTLVSAVTFRPPGPLAVAVAQVDEMSGGRVELGLGAGWFDGEHAAYGVAFPPFAERFGMLEEQLEILTGMWGTPVGERYSFTGRCYQVTDSPALPKPVQTRLPLIVGGVGAKRTPRLAARYADEFNAPFLSLAEARAAFDRVEQAGEGSERPTPVLSHAITVCCGRNTAELNRRIENAGVDPTSLAGRAAIGSPQQVVDALAGFASIGATRSYLQLADLTDLDQVALLAEQVAPHVVGL